VGQLLTTLNGRGRAYAEAALSSHAVLVGVVPPDESSGWSYRTLGGVLRPLATGAGGPLLTADMQVWPMRKVRAAKGFENLILVGRASSNDISLGHATVSKLHARLQSSGDNWTVTDAGSSNGTLVNGTPVCPNMPHFLHNQDTIQLGKVQAQFMTVDTLLDTLEGCQRPRGLPA
jgi:hypothetical protein